MNVSELMAQLTQMPQDTDVVVCEDPNGGYGGPESRAIAGVRLQCWTLGEHAKAQRLVLVDPEATDQGEQEERFQLFQDSWPVDPEGVSHMVISRLAATLGMRAKLLSQADRLQCLVQLYRAQRHLLEPKFQRLYDEFETFLSAQS